MRQSLLTPPSALPLATTAMLSVSMDLLLADISYKWSHTIFTIFVHLCLAFFYSTSCFQGVSMLQHVSGMHSFLWLNNSSLYG